MPEATLSIADVVGAEALKRIGVYLESRDRWNPFKDLTNLSGNVADEYQDRFVIELIQNAYDAHPKNVRDGFTHVKV